MKPSEQTKRGASSALARGYGTLAGLGFIGAALLAVPSTLLVRPVPAPEDYLLTLAGIATGFCCIALPWERLSKRWLHLVGVLATVQAAVAVAVFGQPYVAFFFLIAVGVAYVVPTPRELLPQYLLIGVALFGPVVYGPASPESALQLALVVYPVLILTGGILAYLRQRMVADRRSYQLFAEETLALAQRIAGTPLTPAKARSGQTDSLPAWSWLSISARASAVAAAVFAVPLLAAGLAAAGIKLPGVADDAFGQVGIDLPNQDSAAESVLAAGGKYDADANKPRPKEIRGLASSPEPRPEPNESEPNGAGGQTLPDDAAGGAQSAPPTSSTPTPVPAEPVEEPQGITLPTGGGDTDGTHSGGPVGQALEQTIGGLEGLLGLGSTPRAPLAE
jgi:hypothetical protein